MIRKSLAKAFDPLYESPIRGPLGAPRLSAIADISSSNDSTSTATINELLNLNTSTEELGIFIEDIIDEALRRVVPESQENIVDVETETLLEIEDDTAREEINIVDDLFNLNVSGKFVNKTFDLEDEIFKLTNEIGNLDLMGVEPDDVIAGENVDLKPEINITGLDVTSEYKSANTTLHEIEDVPEVKTETIIKVGEELRDKSKIAQELNCATEVLTKNQDCDARNKEIVEIKFKDEDDKDLNENYVRLEAEIQELKLRCNNYDNLQRSYQEKEAAYTELAAKYEEAKSELAARISDNKNLREDCDSKNREILEIKAKLEEDKDLKENYVRLEAEIQELKLRCNNYDNLQRSYQEKQVAYTELAAKYEEAINKPATPSVCDKVEDEAVEILSKQFAMKEKEFECILSNYIQLIEAQSAKYDSVSKECSTAKQHLANLEIAFTDVHQKYERSKTIIEGYKVNEEKLKSTLAMFEATLQKYNEELEMLKRKNLEENNLLKRELKAAKEDYMGKIGKLQSKIKHLEIKSTSLSNALDQKNKECQELTKLCEEMINVKSDDTPND